MASSEEPPVLKIGITGHQRRDGADWDWTRSAIAQILAGCQTRVEGWTSLAGGADQIFAEEVLKQDGKLVAVIPMEHYERAFENEGQRLKYQLLRSQSQRSIQIDETDPQTAFYTAGRMIVDQSKIMVAVWDELPSRGRGGTADVVSYAESKDKDVIILNPISRIFKRSSRSS